MGNALFPSLILYSVLTMRVVYMFFMTAIYGIVSWFKTNNFKSFSSNRLYWHNFFHGAMFVGLLVFLLIIGITTLKLSLKLLGKLRLI